MMAVPRTFNGTGHVRQISLRFVLVKWNDKCKTLVAGEVLLRANEELTTPFTLSEALILPYQNSLEQIPE